MACKNSGRVIERALKSLNNQSFKNIELIVVDGASQDDTLEKVGKFSNLLGAKISQNDTGIYDAFNQGIQIARGEVVYFLNSDDSLYDNAVLEEVAPLFRDNLCIDIVYGKVVFQDPVTRTQNPIGREFSLKDLSDGYLPRHQGFFFRKTLYDDVGKFNTVYRICGDIDFLMRCMKQGKEHHFLDRFIASCVTGGISSSPQYAPLMNLEFSQICFRNLGVEIIGKQMDMVDVNGFYKLWLEIVLLRKRGISSILKDKGIDKAAVHGTFCAGMLMFRDLLMEGIECVGFTDNNKDNWGQVLQGLPVLSPEELQTSFPDVQAVIVTIENQGGYEVARQLEERFAGSLRVFVWRDLIEGYFERSQIGLCQ